MKTTEMTYWMHCSLEGLVRWYVEDSGGTLAWELVRCVPHGHADMERIVQAMGMMQVDRGLLEELYSPEIVEAMEETCLIAVEKLEKAGLIAQAIEALDQAGVPAGYAVAPNSASRDGRMPAWLR